MARRSAWSGGGHAEGFVPIRKAQERPGRGRNSTPRGADIGAEGHGPKVGTTGKTHCEQASASPGGQWSPRADLPSVADEGDPVGWADEVRPAVEWVHPL